MNTTNMLDVVKSTLNSVGFTMQKRSPEIMIVAGSIGVVTATVLACRATLKVPDILDEHAEEIDDLQAAREEEEVTQKEYEKEVTKIYVKTGVEFAKAYGPAVALGVLSLGTVFASNNILRQRNASLAAAYATVDSAFRRYRKNVVDEYGDEIDHNMRYDIKKREMEFTELDAKGKEKTVKRKVDVTDFDPSKISDYARFFDESCAEWEKDAEYNLFFLKCQQATANDLLNSKGHLFLNEVYDLIGIPRSKAGQSIGWVANKGREPLKVVDFGIYDIYKERNRDFVNGYERSILLDFNVDGDILNKI